MIVTGLDIETTGLDQTKGHRIIEISALVYTISHAGAEPELRVKYEQRINPMRSIDPGSENVHGISLMDLRESPEWSEVAPAVKKLLDMSEMVVAHNAEFDIPFIVFELDRLKIPIPEFDVFCTMENGRDATALGKLPNLGELCFAMNVDYDPSKAHAALYDTQCMMDCFWFGVKTGFFKLFETA